MVKDLRNIAKDPQQRAFLIQASSQLVEKQVQKTSGISGMALKGAFAVVKAISPQFVNKAVDHLLDDFVEKVFPFVQEHQANAPGRPLFEHFSKKQTEITNALLQVSDSKVSDVQNRTFLSVYKKLRPTASKYVEGAIGDLAHMIENL